MIYVCDVCGWQYNEADGSPECDLAPGTVWKDVPKDFTCPLCGAPKNTFSAQ